MRRNRPLLGELQKPARDRPVAGAGLDRDDPRCRDKETGRAKQSQDGSAENPAAEQTRESWSVIALCALSKNAADHAIIPSPARPRAIVRRSATILPPCRRFRRPAA